MTAQTLTIVFTDIKDFTARTSRSSRAEVVALLQRHEELLRPIVLAHGGTVVKTIGDAFLLTFHSPTNAVLCGLRLQARLRQYNREAPAEEQIHVRIAINTGEVELIGDDVY
ncbi:MAG: adenylate/guanylate cyclase domain-containing protein, partial [Gammaproteobacteria bacterium]|nr:adenylate/guanylate cyclase domain-containing protein [Gammaproteobacteria bacterium]NIR97990.1 adenylate/guanylate cyclase domain-containing protein [Gammaproteobacteria bacterium]NIT63688.1 adenylate/guanylate cyclase domain-containing protein [Gammaproteobacteria bacterium]NIV20617.1 adenylate/guanylate cyclase domain-containing protein [Gammaproteobacteria bacterium]NIY32268.1 adenylate/guanylate cyclase domain-containing protein [Gammaproteobacteria bacterium]